MKPIIGINCDISRGKPPEQVEVQSTYFKSVLEAGGIPVLIPPMSDDDLNQVLKKIDGLMLIGGPDYDPKHYKEEPCGKISYCAPLRDEFDLRLVQRAIVGTNMPVLGICAGAQALNIGLGGTLIQDIPSELPDSHVEHRMTKGWGEGFNNHKVTLLPNSKLFKIYGTKDLSVPTSHHQAVRRLGAGLKPAAHAEDDVIEAVEYEDKPFVIGVQWHPERDFEGNKKLFEEFVKYAAKLSAVAAR